ncbi:hypothetical protein SOVF_018780 [Spinacia oleracea]|uniref:Plastid-lipid-associated protein 6, chloroplastic n=1 Tax=Spinacia oleracea TaxID=3562 RepID=A0A9R0JV39_SPIOL|nr:plastid-lipid-associated protein 6, chloroplastic [Spinacia oleracea]KNA24114.1 hypothetical protein SOVF_018780 [Spinacia oleracea]
MATLLLSPVHPQPRLSLSSSSLSTSSPLVSREFQSFDGKFQSSQLSYTQKGRTLSPKLQVSVTDYPPTPPPLPSSEFKDLVSSLKIKLLSVVSGLNRGLAANVDDLRLADDVARELEAAGGPVDLSYDLDKLQGRWKLIYSSAFSSRTLGGSRPGPPIGRLLPITLGQVYQRIDVFSKDFDNIVEIELGAPWPLPPVEVTATLAHKFEIIGSATVKIVFEKTTVKTTGNLSQLPPFEVPQIPEAFRPSSNPGSGDFEVTYMDADTRITRGDRGELRVFVIS